MFVIRELYGQKRRFEELKLWAPMSGISNRGVV